MFRDWNPLLSNSGMKRIQLLGPNVAQQWDLNFFYKNYQKLLLEGVVGQE
jgi:hypothetical protein